MASVIFPGCSAAPADTRAAAIASGVKSAARLEMIDTSSSPRSRPCRLRLRVLRQPAAGSLAGDWSLRRVDVPVRIDRDALACGPLEIVVRVRRHERQHLVLLRAADADAGPPVGMACRA